MNKQDFSMMSEQILNSSIPFKPSLFNTRNNDPFNQTQTWESFELQQPAFSNNFFFQNKKDTLDQIDDESLFDNNFSQMQCQYVNPVVQKETFEEQIVQEKENIEMKKNLQEIKLQPFQLHDFQEPGVVFDPPQFEEQSSSNQLLSNSKKIHKGDALKKDYDKNICRYLARMVVRCFVNSTYKQEVLRFCNKDDKLYESAKQFFLSNIESITGHRSLKSLLETSEDDPNNNEKKAFRKFGLWFLKERALRLIMMGNMKDKLSYVRYKNQIMIKFIDKPELWASNKIKKKMIMLQKLQQRSQQN